MSTTDLKKSVLNSIDNADERLLKMIKDLVETYQEEEVDYETPQWHKEILEDRLKIYKMNPDDLVSWEDIKETW